MVGISRKMGWEIIKRVFLPALLFVLLIVAYARYRIYIVPLIPESIHQDLLKYIGTIFIFCGCLVFQRIASAVADWYQENIAPNTETELDDKLIPLIRRSANIIIWVIGLVLILPLYGVNISVLVASMGVGSLAIALAAQDTIANIIAGFLIMIDAPFSIGDRIKIPSGEIVEVLDIGVRRSHFLAEDKSVIIVPNQDLSKSKIINYTLGQKHKTGS
ncbi:MAG: mechanosensitive ion channel [Candidatus Omnitrophica bacterium]|nr:mechanosensitive ion channel [Candidatus Omnitrophota bacterium]